MSQILGEGTRVPVPQPHGLYEILGTFGDIFDYIHPDHTLDPRWQTDFLESTTLPFPMVLSRDRNAHCTPDHLSQGSVRNRRRCVQIQSAGLQNKITSFGGCFSFRPQRTGTKLSAHAWGIAIDLNPETNAQGTAGGHGSGNRWNFPQCRVSMGRQLAGKNPRSHALSVL